MSKRLYIFKTFRYSTIHGGVRIGRLLEDMDVFAVHLGKLYDMGIVIWRVFGMCPILVHPYLFLE